jgi:hypothetical protein
MRLLRSALVVVALGVFSTSVSAAPILIDFESMADGEALGAQFTADGIFFNGATALIAGSQGGSLNDVDFPTFSGNAVVYDSDSSGIRIDVVGGATSLSGYFTYVTPVTLTAFSETGAVLGSATSRFGSNIGFGPNELLELSLTGVAAYFTIVGDPNGGSFTMDDLTVDTLDTLPAPVPEPGTVTLMLLGASVLAGRKKLHGFRPGRWRVAR